MVFIWVVGGFPPFLLFITKFYIVCYAWSSSLVYTVAIVWFIINTFGIYGYIKGISLFIIRYNKEYYTYFMTIMFPTVYVIFSKSSTNYNK